VGWEIPVKRRRKPEPGILCRGGKKDCSMRKRGPIRSEFGGSVTGGELKKTKKKEKELQVLAQFTVRALAHPLRVARPRQGDSDR